MEAVASATVAPYVASAPQETDPNRGATLRQPIVIDDAVGLPTIGPSQTPSGNEPSGMQRDVFPPRPQPTSGSAPSAPAHSATRTRERRRGERTPRARIMGVRRPRFRARILDPRGGQALGSAASRSARTRRVE